MLTNRYSKEDLAEFEELILLKMAISHKEINSIEGSLNQLYANRTDETLTLSISTKDFPRYLFKNGITGGYKASLKGNDIPEEECLKYRIFHEYMAKHHKETYKQYIGQINYLFKLEIALEYIKNGAYGICPLTGRLISKDMLKRNPLTYLSIPNIPKGFKGPYSIQTGEYNIR